MANRWGAGPVFEFEALMASRRWQVYAGRALLVAGLLAGLAVVWITRVVGHSFQSIHELSQVGHAFFMAILGVELVLVLMVSPAAAAGAVCHDRSRGGLTHLLVTDLSDSEIVLGKLAARLATVLGIVVCALPVLVLSTLLGGVDPNAIVWGSLVVSGVAVLGVSVALLLSVWASKAHEALTATYAAWSIWLLALPAVEELVPSRGAVLLGIQQTNPFWLIFASRPSASVALWQCSRFLLGSLALSGLLALVATRRLRAVTLRRAGRASTRPARRFGRFRLIPTKTAEGLLDRHPILWRERHRRQPSGWNRALWRLFAAISVVFTLLAIVDNDIAPGTNGFQVSIGLLLVSVSAATALAEERVQGSLDVILATPLSTREIVLGKWLGAYRPVPWLAIMPGLLMLGVSRTAEPGLAIMGALLMVGLVLAYGAAIVSLGLLVATWQRRLGRAIALNVTAYLAATVVWPTLLLATDSGGIERIFAFGVSPFFGAFVPLVGVIWRGSFYSSDHYMISALLLICSLAAASAFLLLLTFVTFDRCLGRVAANGRPPRSRKRGSPTAPEPVRTDALGRDAAG